MNQLFLQDWMPDCINVPRFMEAQDFLPIMRDEDLMLEICICGRTFNTNYGDRNLCRDCTKSIDAHHEYLEESLNEANN